MAKKKEKEIEIEQEEVTNAEPHTENAEQEEEAGPTPEETIAKLQADIEQSEKARKEAEERASRLDKERGEAVSQSATAHQSAVQMHEQALENGLSAANAAIAHIEQQLEDAYNTGDSKRIVELNKNLASEAIKLSKLEDSKLSFNKWKEAQKNAPQAEGGYSQTTRDWIARHPQFETNAEYKAEAIGAHSAAVARGYKPDTPAYFEFIDKRLEAQFAGGNEPAPKPSAQKMPSAAPSRDGGTVTGRREGGRVATAKDIEAAETCGMSIGEYMKAKEQAEKEGLLK